MTPRCTPAPGRSRRGDELLDAGSAVASLAFGDVALVALLATASRGGLTAGTGDCHLRLASGGPWSVGGLAGSRFRSLGGGDLLSLRGLARNGSLAVVRCCTTGRGLVLVEQVRGIGLGHEPALASGGVVRVQDALLGGLVERADRRGHGLRAVALGTSQRNARRSLHERACRASRSLVDGVPANSLANALEGLGRPSALPGSSLSCHVESSAGDEHEIAPRREAPAAKYSTAPRHPNLGARQARRQRRYFAGSMAVAVTVATASPRRTSLVGETSGSARRHHAAATACAIVGPRNPRVSI